jgi:hypothetical protein
MPRCAAEFRFVCGDSVGITGRARTCGDSVGLWRLPPEARPASPPTLECQQLTHPPLHTVTRDSTAHEPSLTTRRGRMPTCVLTAGLRLGGRSAGPGFVAGVDGCPC